MTKNIHGGSIQFDGSEDYVGTEQVEGITGNAGRWEGGDGLFCCGTLLVLIVVLVAVIVLVTEPNRIESIQVGVLTQEVTKLEAEIYSLKEVLRWEYTLRTGVLSDLEVLELDAVELKLKTLIEKEIGG